MILFPLVVFLLTNFFYIKFRKVDKPYNRRKIVLLWISSTALSHLLFYTLYFSIYRDIIPYISNSNILNYLFFPILPIFIQIITVELLIRVMKLRPQ